MPLFSNDDNLTVVSSTATVGDDNPAFAMPSVTIPVDADHPLQNSPDELNPSDTDDSSNGSEDTITVQPWLQECPLCPQSFSDEIALSDHLILVHNHGLLNTPLLMHPPINSAGTYQCPICSNRYTTDLQLNQHFSLSHDSPDDLLRMDQTIIKNGHPSIEILVYLHMIHPLTKKETRRLDEDTMCPICCFNFDRTISKSGPDRRPVQSLCCSHMFCRDCCLQSLNATSRVCCPICRTDHERTDLDYIRIVEFTHPNDSWTNWWKNIEKPVDPNAPIE